MIKTTNLKNTSVAWMPEIPSNWDLMRGKFLFKSRKVINDKMQCNDRLGLTLRGVIDRFEGDGVGLNPNDLRTYQIFNENELVFKLIDLENKNTSRVGFVHKRGIMSSAYIRVMNNANVNMRYFYYQYYNLYQRFIFNMIGQGVRATMSSSDLLNIPVAIPPLEVQNRIVAYLDKKNNKIDQFIRNKERLIELLERQAERVISNAINKGVNKNAENKFINDDWLDNIPKHWDYKPLKYFVRMNQFALTEKTKSDYELQYIDIGNVTFKGVINEPEKMLFKNAPSRARRIVKAGDTIMSTVRTYLKAIAFFDNADENIIASTGFAVLTPNKNVKPKYLKYLLSSSYFINKVSFWAVGVNYPGINNDRLNAIKIPVSSTLEEQQEILNFIEIETSKIDSAISKAQKEITSIKEYREALITDLVTGKRSVPESQRI